MWIFIPPFSLKPCRKNCPQSQCVFMMQHIFIKAYCIRCKCDVSMYHVLACMGPTYISPSRVMHTNTKILEPKIFQGSTAPYLTNDKQCCVTQVACAAPWLVICTMILTEGRAGWTWLYLRGSGFTSFMHGNASQSHNFQYNEIEWKKIAWLTGI